MEKTLIIHPKDESTDFLKSIYKNVNSPTILNSRLTKEEVHTLIYHYDQVMMMGHGCPSGLFGVNWGYHLIIDDSNVHALKQKDNNVFIWCHANRFVEQHNLKGFYSGMFISEVNEAIYYNIESNELPLITGCCVVNVSPNISNNAS